MPYVTKGARVCIVTNARATNQRTKKHKFQGRCGVMLEEGDIGPSAGADVYDVKIGRTEIAAHGYALRRAGKGAKRHVPPPTRPRR